MSKIIRIKEINLIKKEKNQGKKIVILGGSFDVLHAGHIEFIKRASMLGDELIILLESDESIKKLKGENRPVNIQAIRAKVLSSIKEITYIICLPYFKADNEYKKLVLQLEPDIIAVTSGTYIFEWEKDYVKDSGATIVTVMKKRGIYSTSNLINKT